MLLGKQLSRAMRGIKIIYEALFRLCFESAKVWLAIKHRNVPALADVAAKVRNIQKAFAEHDRSSCVNLTVELEENHASNILEFLSEFRRKGCKQSVTFMQVLG
jgi:hypothetical protein